MLDTVGIWIKSPDNLNRILSRLSNRKTVLAEDTGTMKHTGNLYNLKVCASDKAIKIHGSVASFCNGNNLEALPFAEYKNAFDAISNAIGINVEDGILCRLDVGCVLPVSQPVVEYTERLLRLAHHERDYYNNTQTVKFRNTVSEFIAYDKAAECLKHGVSIPEPFWERHLVRLEARLKQSQKILTVCGSRRVADLCTPEVQTALVKHWQRCYHNIEKSVDNSISASYPTRQTSAQFLNTMLGCYLAEHTAEVLEQLKIARTSGMSAKEATRARQKIRKATEQFPLHDCMKELGNLVDSEAMMLLDTLKE